MNKGLTVSLIPHGGRPPRQFEISGRKLVLLRLGVVFAILLLLGAAYIVVRQAAGEAGSGSLSSRVAVLEDSLAATRGMEARLDSIEVLLEEIRLVRQRLENISELAGP